MQYTIEEIRHKVFDKIYDVYEVFKNHFGEEFVDLQGLPPDAEIRAILSVLFDLLIESSDESIELSDGNIETLKERYSNIRASIIVWWPRVTVTNEHNKSITIQDLFARVIVNLGGMIPYEFHGFELNRSTYDSTQFQSGYSHSHIPGFRPQNSTSEIIKWERPCLGTGPIKYTIVELKNNNDEITWMLFCEELARYVTVESLTGGPYRMLEQVGSSELLRDYTDYTITEKIYLESFNRFQNQEDFINWLKEFALYYLQHGHLCFNYQDGVFKPGMSYFDFMIDISNSFIEWFNQTGSESQVDMLYCNHTLINSFAANGRFYKARNASNIDASRHEGTTVLKFKGRDILLHIETIQETGMETTTLLNHRIAMFIIQSILTIINYRYRNEYNLQHRTGGKTTTPTYQTVCHI